MGLDYLTFEASAALMDSFTHIAYSLFYHIPHPKLLRRYKYYYMIVLYFSFYKLFHILVDECFFF